MSKKAGSASSYLRSMKLKCYRSVFEDVAKGAKDLKLKAPEARHAIVTVMGQDQREKLEWLSGSLNL